MFPKVTFEIEPDPFSPHGPDRLRQHRLKAKDVPFRAVGGNVLLRRVKGDVSLFLVEGRDDRSLQVGEVCGIGSRWTQDKKWWPPMPRVERGVLDNGKPDPTWTPPDLSNVPRCPPPRFGVGHVDALVEIAVGSLVVYNKARIYDTFRWEGEDFLVYPGNWIHGVVEDTYLAENPDVRRYEPTPL